MPPLILRSPAKLNLVLDILRKRDDGYHEVDLVMQELDWHDDVTLETIPDDPRITITCTDPTVPTDERNVCHTAARLLQVECEKKGKPMEGVRIHLAKKIPATGGLGGGSSNAAAVLTGLNDAWGLGLSRDALSVLGGKIGSDVPFFFYGKTCRATGRGEIITLLPSCPRLEIAFLVPPVPVPPAKTKWIYGAFDVDKVGFHPSALELIAALETGDPADIAHGMGNVFETLELPEYAPVFSLIEEMRKMPGVLQCVLAGAGPTVAIVCETRKLAHQVIEPFRARGWIGFVTHTAGAEE
ncbi:MAG: 4-(cytidine 5'-diphospho)-2-C-methyl-D-erythritol kinase [Candidatus Diapherotrites archaeon]|nr:4-(cytidine 5'-diphospho)-2-C-methyl-D-erythritol kinase [Candidatus Diapherotrites archaeon]MDZ4256754.1 4-(cytidine 5'-diphospho)-2-C-methyl-D-erythritol kinase [archaeon]